MAKPTEIFLTTDNMNYISSLLFRFFSDTYHVRLTDIMTKEEYYKIMGDTMIGIYKQKKMAPLAELNQTALHQLKNQIKQTYITPPSPPPPVETNPPAPILPEIPTQPPPSNGSFTLSEDSDFFNKVQQLEFQRKTFAVPTPSSPEPIPKTNPQPSHFSAPPTVPIYTPMPPPIYKEILITSNQSDFEWNGPLPTLSDSHLRVCAWVASLLVPWIQLHCQAPNGDTQMVTLLPKQTVGLYTIYTPASEHLGYLKRWSLPWKLSFHTMNEKVSVSMMHQLILEHAA